MATRISLNDECRVVLKQGGVEALREYYEDLPLNPPDVEEGSDYTDTLWGIMAIFGKKMSHRGEPPFETKMTIISRTWDVFK